MSDAQAPGPKAAGAGSKMPDQGPGGVGSGNPDMAAGEAARLQEMGLEVQLDEQLAKVRDRLVGRFGGLGEPDEYGRGLVTEVSGFRGELTLVVRPEGIIEVLRFCRDDPELSCELLADLSGVHWPGGRKVEAAQETTGWPAYEIGEEEGRIELDYVLYSVTHNHRFRLRTNLPDDDSRIASATQVYGSANFMEREAYDFFGVVFEGHPDLRRILMPDEWEGYPHRKDYPLGGVEVVYKGATIPPPDQRKY